MPSSFEEMNISRSNEVIHRDDDKQNSGDKFESTNLSSTTDAPPLRKSEEHENGDLQPNNTLDVVWTKNHINNITHRPRASIEPFQVNYYSSFIIPEYCHYQFIEVIFPCKYTFSINFRWVNRNKASTLRMHLVAQFRYSRKVWRQR